MGMNRLALIYLTGRFIIGSCGPTIQIAAQYNKWTEKFENPNGQEADQLARYKRRTEDDLEQIQLVVKAGLGITRSTALTTRPSCFLNPVGNSSQRPGPPGEANETEWMIRIEGRVTSPALPSLLKANPLQVSNANPLYYKYLKRTKTNVFVIIQDSKKALRIITFYISRWNLFVILTVFSLKAFMITENVKNRMKKVENLQLVAIACARDWLRKDGKKSEHWQQISYFLVF